ncbi:MAG: heme exporter, ATP-binding protein CcmA [Hyphomicrobiales bacterium]|nr:heme exporter, ATP-binding protein CcmA [Hyphomicrobiales bacterium]
MPVSAARFSNFRLSTESLALERGGRILLSALDLSLDAGCALVVTGRNGAGKSTLLRALAGLLPPASGRIRLAGADGKDADSGTHTHYAGHLDASKGTLTARENLAFWQSMLALPAYPSPMSPENALTRLALPHVADLPVGYLSAGQRRRVGLARLLLAPRPLWLLDEPMNALDTQAQHLFTQCMREHLANGGIIVAATHAPLGIPAMQLELGSPQDGGEHAS